MSNAPTTVKTVRKWFDTSQYEAEQTFLEEMHRQGWCFTTKKCLGTKFCFVPCEPEEMVYQIDYNPQALKKDPEYLQMFWDLGWESCYIKDGIIIFRKPKRLMNGSEEIYCDPENKLERMKRSISRILAWVPYWIFISIYWIGSMARDLHQYGFDGFELVLLILHAFIFVLYLTIVVRTLARYLRFKKKL